MDQLTPTNAKELAGWLLRRLGTHETAGPKGYARQASMAAKLVGKVGQAGDWTPRQVMRAVEVFEETTGRTCNSFAILDSNWTAPNGLTWMEFSNPPEPEIIKRMPPIHDAIQLRGFLDEWGDCLSIRTKNLLGQHVQGQLRRAA